MPRSTELLRDIHEINLMYLLLLQRIARSSDASESGGLTISPQARQWLAGLQPAELIKLARSSVMLAQLNLPPHLLLSALSQGIDEALAQRAKALPERWEPESATQPPLPLPPL